MSRTTRILVGALSIALLGGTAYAVPPPARAVVEPGDWYAFGVEATGAVELAAEPLVSGGPETDQGMAVTDVGDLEGRVEATDAEVSLSQTRVASSLGYLHLFPDTDAEVELADLETVATSTGVVVRSEGGTVLGHPVPAGPIAPGTSYELEGTSTVVHLAVTEADASGLTVVRGLVLTSPDDLETTVTAAAIAIGELQAPPVLAPTTVAATQVRSAVWGTPTALSIRTTGAGAGRVFIRQGRGMMASAAVVGGRASLRLPAWLGAGRNSLEVVFQPDSEEAAASTTTAVVRVAQLRPRLSVRASGPRLRVQIGGLPHWSVAPHVVWVKVYDQARPHRLLTLKQAVGSRVRLTVPGLSPGRHRLRVEIPGAESVNIKRTVRKVRVRVRP